MVIGFERILKCKKYKVRRKEPPGLLCTIATFKSLVDEEDEAEKMKQVSSLITVVVFFLFVWLHQVLHVVHRLFNGHSSMWGL